MGRYCTSLEVDTTVTVDLDWEDLDTDEMLEELERRRALPESEDLPQDLVKRIYFKRKAGEDHTRDLDDLIYRVIGRIV